MTSSVENVEKTPVAIDYQREFDHYLLEHWRKGNIKCCVLCLWFLERCGIDISPQYQNRYSIAMATCRELGITRMPSDDWMFDTIGPWMAAAYPKLLDLIAKTKDARIIDLSTLQYVAKPRKPNRAESSRRDYIKKKEQQAVIQQAVEAAVYKHQQDMKKRRNKLKGHVDAYAK